MTRSQYGLIAIAIGLILVGAYFALKPKRIEDPRGKPVSVYPLHTVCRVFDMTKAGYKLIRNDFDRHSCKTYIQEMETNFCYHKYGDKSLGKEIVLRNEWCAPRIR